MYTPRHSATYFKRIERQLTRRKRWFAAFQDVCMGVFGGAVIGLLLGLMFVV